MLAYVKHQWALGNRRDAFARLQSLVGELRYGRGRTSLASPFFFAVLFFVFTYGVVRDERPDPRENDDIS